MSLRNTIERVTEMKTPIDQHSLMYKQPWAMFSTTGERLTSLESVLNRIVFIFEGGQFVWPGIRIGHKTVVNNLQGIGHVTMETLSMTPLVFSVEEFLTDDEIETILQLSLPHLKPSGVTHSDQHVGRPSTDWRTSTTYFLASKHPAVKNIDQRTAQLTKIPESHQEDVQVLRYEKTQKYDAHTDYFKVEGHLKKPAFLETLQYGHKNRMVTVFWYMSDVAEGGHTVFPRSGGLPPPTDLKDCSNGLRVAPKKRKVIVFYNMLPNGQSDPMSLHGGCPVIKGLKYSGNKWVWNKPRRT